MINLPNASEYTIRPVPVIDGRYRTAFSGTTVLEEKSEQAHFDSTPSTPGGIEGLCGTVVGAQQHFFSYQELGYFMDRIIGTRAAESRCKASY
jgi:hypothetical protein